MKIFLVRLSWLLHGHANIYQSEYELITATTEAAALIVAGVLNVRRRSIHENLSEEIIEVAAVL